MPAVAWHPYADVTPRFPSMVQTNGTGLPGRPWFNGTVNATRLRLMRRGYYASLSYTDYNLGRILHKLDATGLRNNTAVVLVGDHGYHCERLLFILISLSPWLSFLLLPSLSHPSPSAKVGEQGTW